MRPSNERHPGSERGLRRVWPPLRYVSSGAQSRAKSVSPDLKVCAAKASGLFHPPKWTSLKRSTRIIFFWNVRPIPRKRKKQLAELSQHYSGILGTPVGRSSRRSTFLLDQSSK